jgi:hypothetical protein
MKSCNMGYSHSEHKMAKKSKKSAKAMKHPKPKKSPKPKAKVKKVMDEFKHGKLHSGSKKGPKVTNPKQAIAIALSEQRKANKKKK